MAKEPTKMETIVSFAKRKGFIFPTAEIYGGLQGFWDYGPLGVELKNNIKKAWWKRFVQERSDVVGLDSAIITNPKVFEKSGHITGFHDTLVECKKCHTRSRPDDIGGKKNPICPQCGKKEFTESKEFNTMFATSVGPVKDAGATAYLRPETAQGIFVNFENVVSSSRVKLPFGIGQIGKAFRNEITPGNFIFRSREFEQMELEFFCKDGDDETWFLYWREETMKWFEDLGLQKKHLRFFDQPKQELAHYSKATTDIEYKFPFDKEWMELAGVANRQDFDLKAHNQTFRDEESKSAIIPFCIEPSLGVDRLALALLLDAYEEVAGGRTTTTESNKEAEVVLRLHKSLAPVKVAILPLSKKEPLAKLAKEIAETCKKHFVTAYDEVASIGRRYRRQDEIGTPYCVTIDFDSLEDKKVTVRDRDTMQQERIPIEKIANVLIDKLAT